MVQSWPSSHESNLGRHAVGQLLQHMRYLRVGSWPWQLVGSFLLKNPARNLVKQCGKGESEAKLLQSERCLRAKLDLPASAVCEIEVRDAWGCQGGIRADMCVCHQRKKKAHTIQVRWSSLQQSRAILTRLSLHAARERGGTGHQPRSKDVPTDFVPPPPGIEPGSSA